MKRKLFFIFLSLLGVFARAQHDFNTWPTVINKSIVGTNNQSYNLQSISSYYDDEQIVLKNNGTGSFTINAAAGETIDGVASYLLECQNGFIGIVKDPDNATNWTVIHEEPDCLETTEISGRFEIDVDYDWASWSDPNYGPHWPDWDFDLADNGVGGIPDIDWDAMGLAFPKGAILRSVFVKARGNSADIDVVEFYARVHEIDLLAQAAVDSNAEVGATEVTNGIISIDLDAGAANANDIVYFEIDLNDYEIQNMGADLHFMMKAQNGSLTANRQVRCTMIIFWDMP